MDSTNCEVIDVELRFPPGVKTIIGQGVSSFIGLLDDGETVLKYPLLPDDRFRIEIEHQLLQHAVHLHSRSVYHSDLRPANILLDENLNIKLADIQGVLRSADDGGKVVVLDGLARESSMYYMPRDDGDWVDAKTHLFAFGSTVHFVMTGGQDVFPDLVVDPSTAGGLSGREHDDEIDDEISRRFVEHEFPSASYLCASLVRRCWRGEYASADEVLADLTLELEASDANANNRSRPYFS
ncbi:hypothetical protein DV735_g4093, partial [Chaetothyriales sp. CBS 134920]